MSEYIYIYVNGEKKCTKYIISPHELTNMHVLIVRSTLHSRRCVDHTSETLKRGKRGRSTKPAMAVDGGSRYSGNRRVGHRYGHNRGLRHAVQAGHDNNNVRGDASELRPPPMPWTGHMRNINQLGAECGVFLTIHFEFIFHVLSNPTKP